VVHREQLSSKRERSYYFFDFFLATLRRGAFLTTLRAFVFFAFLALAMIIPFMCLG